MVLLNSLIWSFYPFSSLLFLFGKKKEETTQAPATQGIPVPQQNIPTPGNIPAAKAEEKPIFRIEQPTIPMLPDVKDPATFSIKYPLIPPYTFARIRWDSAATELVYEIEEPVLTDNEKQVLDTLEDGIKELINLSFISVKDRDTVLIYLEKNIRVLLAELSIELSTESFLKIMYYIYRDFVGLNELEPLMNDYFIEDIECNGLNSPVYLVHRKYRNIRTNLVYKDIHKMAAFVEKLAQKCGRYISYAEPLLDGSLPDGSRIQAVYSTDVASKGPSFCIVDGYIQLNNGEVKKIDKLFDESKKNFGFKVEDKNEIVEVTNIKCCGVNEKDLSQNDSKIKTIIKLSPPKKLVEIKLEDGTEITTTTNHLFHVADDELKLIEAEKLIQGMFIPIPNKIHVEGCNQSINIHNLLKEFSYNYKICAISNTRIKELINQEIFNYTNIDEHNKYRQNISKEYGVGSTYFYEIISRGNSISFEVLEKICDTRNVNLNEIENLQIIVYGGGGKNASKVISIPRQVDEDLAYLAGAIISDGHLGENHIDVAAYESGFNEAVYTKLIKLFGKSQKYYGGNRIYLCNILASFYFNKIFGIPYGKKARIVSVPEIIFRSNNKVVASFLKGLFDGDGTCFGGLSYKTYSKCLANEISYLLTRFGIYSYIKTNGEENKIVIPSIYEKDYYEKIGFENKIKKVQLEKLLSRKNKVYKTYIRHGRVPAKPVLNLLKEFGISKNYISKKCNVSYNRLVYYDSLSKPFVNDIIKLIEEKDIKNNKVDYLYWLANSEQEFVKINSIKIFDNFENKSVYDIEIEPCKFFIGGNRPMNLFDTVRRFTKEPWSPLQLIIKGTCTSEIYAYIWMAVEYENSLMIVGGTGSGKTSFVNTVAFFIPPQARVVSIEDSVTGNSELILKVKDEIVKINIADITKKVHTKKIDINDIEVLTLDDTQKIKFTKPKSFIKHRTTKDIYRVTTSTGRIIDVTKDHSLFTLSIDGLLEVKPEDLEIGNSCIATPRFLPIEGKGIYSFDLTNCLDIFKEDFLCGEPLIKLFEKYNRKNFRTNKPRYRWWKNKKIIKIKELKKISYKFNDEEKNKLFIKSKNTTKIPVIIRLDEPLLKLIGLWLGDGSYDNYNKNRVIISDNEKEAIEVYKSISRRFNIKIDLMKDDWSWAFNSTVFYKFMKYVLKLDGEAKTKKIPKFVYNLTNEQLKHLISGYFGADGSVPNKNEITATSQSFDLLYGIQTFLLRFGIISRIGKYTREDGCKDLRISSYENINKFKEISFVHQIKNEKLNLLGNKKPYHTCSDVIPINPMWFDDITPYRKYFRTYSTSDSLPGRNYLNSLLNNPEIDLPELPSKFFEQFTNSDILWDKVVKIEKLPKKMRCVYDISVPETEKFISQNIILHNTKELQLEHENWLPSVARAGAGLTNLVGQKYGEVSLFDLLKASFRQRPDYIIVGEVRGSIRGNEEIVVIENGITKRVPIKELEGKDISNMFVPTLDKNLKVELHKIKHFIKHPPRSKLLEVVTRTGRKVVVTHDHSLFTADGCEVKPIETSKLNLGDKILIPASMPCGYNDVDKINLIEYFPELRIYNVQDKIKEAISKLGQEKANKICGCVARQYCRKKQKTSVPIKHFVELMKAANIKYNLEDHQIKNGNSKLVPKDITVNEDFCRFLGYYLAEGHIQNTNRDVVITNSNKIIINDVIKISKKLFGITPKLKRVYGYGKSWHIIIHSTIITRLINNLCGKTENKRVPSLIYGLSRNKINAFLNGAYSGDGNNYKNEISFASKLVKLSEDIMYLLLAIGIVSRIRKEKNKNLFKVLFKRIEDTKKFLDEVGFTQKNYKVLQKGPSHSNVNVVNFKEGDFNKLKLPRKYRHLKRFMKCSKYYLQNIINDVGAHDDIKKFANGEFYLDEIKQLNDINLKVAEPVYDLSINPTENFIGGFGGIVLHNSEAFVLFQAFASVRGDEEIFVLYEDKPLRVKIKDLESYDINKLKTISYNVKENKCEILPVKGWIKHPKRNTLYKITTKTGREVTITQDHSLFTYENEKVKEIKGENLVIGSNIVIPSYVECGYNNITRINLLEYLPDLRIYAPEYVKEASHKLGYCQTNVLVGSKSITDYYSEGIVSKPNAMKAETFTKLMREAHINYNIENLKVKFNGMSEKSSVFLDLSGEFLRLLGYYISEGSLNTSGRNYRIELYNSDEMILEDMEKCIIKVSNKKPKKRITDRGWGSATELSFNHKVLYEFIKRYCGTKLEKGIPDLIYGLDKKRIGIFLSALYAGDGAVMDKGIGYYTTSKKLANDVTQLLLVYGIVATISKRNREGRKTTDYEINFYANYKKEEFLKYAKPISKTCKIIEGVEDKKLLNHLYCDTVKGIEVLHLDEPEYVYDIAVPGNENFIGGFGSVLLHNSGHPGMATMHAESVETMVKRLETAPINLSGSLIETLAAVIVMTQSKIKGKEVRKVSSVDEIIEVKEHEGGTKTNTVFKWDPKTDKFTFNPNSKVFENISTHFGFTKEQVLNEFNIRVKLIKELFRRGIVGFKDVQKIIHEYYKAPETVLKRYGIK